MSYSLYSKPYKEPSDLITHMKSKGLIIKDVDSAINFLKNINYYRFKIYLVPLLSPNSESYISSASFEQGVEMYRFDDELRHILFSVIGRMEIKLRSRLDQVITAHIGNPFWYLDDSLFIRVKLGQVNGFRAKLASSFQYSKDEFSSHFKTKYFNDTNPSFKQLPPFWVLAELTTFGNIRVLYQSVNKAKFKAPNNTNKLDSLAHEFGASNIKELNNWIDLIRDVRNRCAHHSRVWNCNYREPRSISNLLSSTHKPARQNRIYLFVALLHKMDKSLKLNIDIKEPLLGLFNMYGAAKTNAASAGFPSGWDSDKFWS